MSVARTSKPEVGPLSIMKTEPKLLSASVRYDGGKPTAVLELQLDPRDALELTAAIQVDGRLLPIRQLAEQLDKADAEERAATTTPTE